MRVPPTPAIIDIEASGFGKGSYPIEIGLVLSDGDAYCSLIYPAMHWTHWSDEAERIHGISRDTLLRHGRSPAEVCATLNDLLAGETAYSDAWGHDMAWLSLLFDEAGMAQHFRLENLSKLLNEQEKSQWHPVKEAISERIEVHRHRASSDARLLQETWLQVKQQRLG